MLERRRDQITASALTNSSLVLGASDCEPTQRLNITAAMNVMPPVRS